MSLFTETGEIDLNKDYFSELVGEGKKYKTNTDVGRALVEKDLFIAQLQKETSEVRSTLAERVKLEEIYDKMSQLANKSPNSGADNQNTNGTNQQQQTPAITPEQIDERLKKTISEWEQQRQAQANEALVKEKMTQKFGSNYPSKLKDEASKLGMSPQQLDQIAATNPAAFFRLVGAEESGLGEKPILPPRGATYVPDPKSGQRTMSWYKQLKKENPVLYNSREMQIQQHKDAEKIGESFFDV